MSTEQMEVICKSFIPKNMKKSTNWAAKVFEQWRVKRNKAASGNDKLCPDNLLVQSDLNYWLSHFMVEACRADRHQYPACSIDFFVFFGMNLGKSLSFVPSMSVQ